MENKQYKVGIIGCGAILVRHIEAIEKNDSFSLVSLCDIDTAKYPADLIPKKSFYTDYKEMIKKEDINFVVIATPNNLHYEQSIYALQNGCDVLVEKPATLDSKLLEKIQRTAKKNKQKAYCVLQVRLNPAVQLVKKMLIRGDLGTIRGVSLVQRWQRPLEYFDGWRGIPEQGGGVLHECGIHYLDVMCYLFGEPKVCHSKHYNTKHKDSPIEDTIYSIIDYGSYGGTIEVTISSEPKNLECSISILTDRGYLKIGGKALNKIEEFSFLDKYKNLKDDICLTSEVRNPNAYVGYEGSCPNHPDLYKNLERFNIKETNMVINTISNIYNKSKLFY